MYKETTNIQRIIAAVVAVVAGIYFVVWAPSQAMWTLKHALEAVMDRLIPYDPDFYTAVPILRVTFGIRIIMIAFGGALLLVVARSMYNGSVSARAVGM